MKITTNPYVLGVLIVIVELIGAFILGINTPFLSSIIGLILVAAIFTFGTKRLISKSERIKIVLTYLAISLILGGFTILNSINLYGDEILVTILSVLFMSFITALFSYWFIGYTNKFLMKLTSNTH